MDYDTSDRPEDAPIQLTAASTAAEILAAMKRQGISDLEAFVDKLVADVQEKAEEEHGEDDSVWRLNLIVHDHYAITYAGVDTEPHT